MLQRVNHDHQIASKTNELKGMRLSNIYMQSFGDCNQLFFSPSCSMCVNMYIQDCIYIHMSMIFRVSTTIFVFVLMPVFHDVT